MSIMYRLLNKLIKPFRSQRTSTAINIIGLSVAAAFSILLLYYIHSETTVDKFHKNNACIYRVVRADECAFNPPFGQYILDNISGTDTYCRTFNIQSVFKYGDNMINSQYCLFADSTFFTMFSFPLVKGEPEIVLGAKRNVVISESIAQKLFNEEDPIGKTIRFRNRMDLVVSGVMEDIKANTHFKPIDVIIPFHGIDAMFGESYLEQFNNRFFLAGLYVKADEHVDLSMKGNELFNLAKKWYWLFQEENSANTVFQPLNEVYFNPASYGYPTGARTGNPRLLVLLRIATICILVVAFINFINLSVIRVLRNSNEIAIRKINGASVIQLILAALIEIFTINILVVLFSGFLIFLALPLFNDITEYTITFWQLLSHSLFIKAEIILFLLCNFLGILLLVLFSGFNSLALIHKEIGKIRISFFQKGLVFFQNTLSTILIIVVLIIVKQTCFLKNFNVGFNKEETLYLRLNADIRNQYRAFKEELGNIDGIINTSFCNSMPGIGIMNYRFVSNNQTKNIDVFQIDEDFFDVMGIHHENPVRFESNSCWITHSAAKTLEYNDEKKYIEIEDYNGRVKLLVNEVLPDMNFHSLYEYPEPTLFTQIDWNNWIDYALLRIQTNDVAQTLNQIRKVYSDFSVNFPLEMSFLDDTINAAYEKEFKTSRIVIIFSILALIISLLGMFVLALASISNRTKEVGIRKVMGAKGLEILTLFYADFIKWVVLAFLISIPVAWLIASSWLRNFVYRTEFSWWIFAFAGLIAVFVALITVTWISWNASRRNPVEALRYE